MKIKFNSLNAVIETITTDEALRQGNVGANTLTATFENKNNVNYTAVFNFTRSDGTRIQNVMMLEGPNSNQFHYTFNNPWFFALAGETTLTIYLRQNGNVIASGQITFDIEETDVENDTTITYEEYQQLLDAISNKQDKYSTHNVRAYDTLQDATDLQDLAVGQVVYIKDNQKFYQVVENENEENELSILKNVIYLYGSSTGTLTSEQLALLDDETIIIKDYGAIYRLSSKQGQNLEIWSYIRLGSMYSPGPAIYVSQEVLTINKSTGAYSITASNFVFYTQSGIDNELAKKVDKVASGSYPFAYGRNNLNQEAVHQIDSNDSDMTAGKLAKRNTRGSVSVPTPIDDNDSAHKKYVDDSISALGTSLRIKGSASVSQLNSSSLVKQYGDMYNLTDSGVLTDGNVSVSVGDNVVWTTSNTWDKLSGAVDLSNYYTKSQVDSKFDDVNDSLATKLNKTSDVSKVYGTDSLGNQKEYDVDSGDTLGEIVKRDVNGQIKVPQTPTDNAHATSKKYVDDALSNKQDILTFDNAPTQNSTNPVTSGGIYTALENVKKNAFKQVDITLYPTLNDFLASTGEEGFTYLYPLDTTDLTKGYYQYIYETENNVGIWISLGTTTIDLSNYAKLDGDQIYTGENAFIGTKRIKIGYQANANHFYYLWVDQYNTFRIDRDNQKFFGIGASDVSSIKFLPISHDTYDIGQYDRAWKSIYLSEYIYLGATTIRSDSGGNIFFRLSGTTDFYGFYGGAFAGIGGNKNLGTNTNKWVDLYLSRNLTDGTNAFTIAQAYGIMFGKVVADNTITELSYENISEISIGADTTFTLKSVPTGCYPEYRAIITNSGASAINLTFTGIAKIITNDSSVAVVDNVMTLPATTTIEISIENGNLVGIVF